MGPQWMTYNQDFLLESTPALAMKKVLSAFECISLTVYSFTFLIGLPANLLVIFVYARKAHKHGATPNVVYTINLCFSNLVLVAWMPVKFADTILEFWMLPKLVCPIYNFFIVTSLYGSGLLLTAVAVGRYLSIAFPIIYKRYRSARNSCIVSIVLWVIVLLHVSLGLVAERGGYFISPTQPNTSKCYENFTHEQLNMLVPLRLEMALLLFAVPLLLSAFCTLRCLVLVHRTFLSASSKRRVLAMELSTLVVFVVCYAPYNISHVVGFAKKDNVNWRGEAIVSSCCNVFLEPVVMLILSPSRQKTVPCGRRLPQQHCSSMKDSLATVQKCFHQMGSHSLNPPKS